MPPTDLAAPFVAPVIPSSEPPEIKFSLLTREEKASLLAGFDFWNLQGVPRLNVPSIQVTDCGHGVTLCGDDTSPATCFPTGVGMAATWNAELLEKTGAVLGRETRGLGCAILLGPKINLHRHPLNGRSFETFSEDPWLAGLLGAAVIRGIQSEGTGACVKAMAANNQQLHQESIDVQVDERTLREIYMRGFQLAVELSQPAAIMTAYNRLNGDYCSESSWLINQIIKEEWKFPGFVVSDWRAVHSDAVYRSGLDLEMPGPGKFLNRSSVLRALEEGLLSEEELDDKAERIFNALLRYGRPTPTATERKSLVDTPENRAIALQVAEESIVLLKNENELLPLDHKVLKKILVVGPNAAEIRLGGGGSASVTPFYSISPLEGIREICRSEVNVRYLEGCSLVGTMEPIHDHFTSLDGNGNRVAGLRADFFNAYDPGSVVSASWTIPKVDFSWGWASPGMGVLRGPFSTRISGWLNPPVSGKYRLGVYAQEGCVEFRIAGEHVAGSWDDAGNGNFEEKYQTHYFTVEREFEKGTPVAIELTYGKRAARAGLRLEWETPGMVNPIDKAVEAAREVDAVIVCAGLSNLFEGGAHDRATMDLPKEQQELIEKISAANPKTVVVLFNGGTIAMPWEARVPALIEAFYPGQEGGRALARILFGQVNPSGRLPDTIARQLEDHIAMANYPGDGNVVRYEEGVFVGYRHFDTASIPPHYPFGFGLSYTTFEIGRPVSCKHNFRSGQIGVTTTVKNTGSRRGKEVVQLYIRPISPPFSRPQKELRAFQKVDLAPGEEIAVNFSLGEREFECFDAETGMWRVIPGDYEILVGSHSRQLQGTTITV